MKIPDLKTDHKLPYHYLIGICMYQLPLKQAGQIYLKYGPVYFHNDDVDRLRDAIMLMQDKLFPTSKEESLSINNVNELVSIISSMILSCRANNGTMHHFSSDCELDSKHFEQLVESSNKSEYIRSLIDNARIQL